VLQDLQHQTRRTLSKQSVLLKLPVLKAREGGAREQNSEDDSIADLYDDDAVLKERTQRRSDTVFEPCAESTILYQLTKNDRNLNISGQSSPLFHSSALSHLYEKQVKTIENTYA